MERDLLSRFGAVINSRAMGGDSRLAAMSVPERRLEEVVGYVNESSVVTHNYVREHSINLWFVLSAENPSIIDRTLERFERDLDLRTYNLPKQTEYYIGLQFYFEQDGTVRTVNRRDSNPNQEPAAVPLSEVERDVVAGLEGGLPLVRQPYLVLSNRLDLPEGKMLEVLNRLLATGRIRRIGCVPNHDALGIRGNGMTVFDVPAREVNRVGRRLGQCPEVTHCYERPRYRPEWPYNLFAMVHGRTREEARNIVRELSKKLGLERYPHEVLFSTRKLKKTGLRLTRASNS
jgi:DNA-binding Lrp family transcriptional regulator